MNQIINKKLVWKSSNLINHESPLLYDNIMAHTIIDNIIVLFVPITDASRYVAIFFNILSLVTKPLNKIIKSNN